MKKFRFLMVLFVLTTAMSSYANTTTTTFAAVECLDDECSGLLGSGD